MQYYTNDDFSVTLDKELITAYRNAIQNNGFISALEKIAPTTEGQTWTRSRFHGYHYEGLFYIDVRTLENELHRNAPRQQTEINGQSFINTNRLQNLNIETCIERTLIFLH